MKGFVIEGADRLAVRDVPTAPLGDYQARTRLVAGSLCNSTDRKLVEGHFPGCARFPAILGHEAVGEVIEVGPKVRNYTRGDLVIRPRQYYPPETGIREYFGSFAELGLVTDAWAQLADAPPVAPPVFGHPQQILPAGVDPMVGVLSITLKETLSWMRRLGVGPGTSALIVGTGPVGASMALWARMLGAPLVILAGRTVSSIARAEAIGKPHATIDTSKGHVPERVREMTGGKGVDRAVEGVGDTALIDLSLACIAPDGVVGLYGVAPDTDAPAAGKDDPRVRKIDPDESEVHDEFFRLVAEGRVDPWAFMSHRLPFDRIGEGFDLLRDRRAFKVALDW